MNRTLRMISECHQVLVRARSESSLLEAICRLAVEAGGYRMSWVGFAEPDEAKTVRVVAQAGFEAGYLEQANISWSDTERGRGPTGRAIRSGQPVIARHILTEPAFAPWRQAAIERGYAASAALPLKREEDVLGALMVYATEPDTFDVDEVGLLTQLADDLAYGINALRTRADQGRITEELRRLSAHLLEVQDRERRHLARELHDTTAQHLAALTLNLNNLKGRLAQEASPNLPLCLDSLKLATQAAQEIRTHSYLLHPPLLDVMGLVGAVEDYAQGFSARSGIIVEVAAAENFGRLAETLELALFRVVQEGLANVLKHSGSGAAKIRFARQMSWVTLEIQDMGKGIPADILARIKARIGGSGVGIGGMQERLRLLGGRLDLESGSTGTTVRATVPLGAPTRETTTRS
ncbi:MAG TPA: GAF domain-containing protein [Verrucomicrobiae bacterium]